MNKDDFKYVLKFYGVCTACAVVLSGSITAGVCFADGTISGSDVLDDTRYSAIGIGDVADIIQFILDMNDGEMPPAVGDADY